MKNLKLRRIVFLALCCDLSLICKRLIAPAANIIVFRLKGLPLALYLSVAVTSGAICGSLCGSLVKRLRPIISPESRNTENTFAYKKWIPRTVTALAGAITILLAVGREMSIDIHTDGALMTNDNGSIYYTDIDHMDLGEVSCKVVDGKSSEKQINTQGISLNSLAAGDFERAIVTSDDG